MWSIITIVLGAVLIAVSVVADVNGGGDGWHFGTAMGAGLIVYGLVSGLSNRRRTRASNR
jgi:predicted phage tail protein